MLETMMSVMGTAVLGVFGWALHLNTRVSVLESQRESLKELIEARFDAVENRLDRIERAMNGHLGEHN